MATPQRCSGRHRQTAAASDDGPEELRALPDGFSVPRCTEPGSTRPASRSTRAAVTWVPPISSTGHASPFRPERWRARGQGTRALTTLAAPGPSGRTCTGPRPPEPPASPRRPESALAHRPVPPGPLRLDHVEDVEPAVSGIVGHRAGLAGQSAGLRKTSPARRRAAPRASRPPAQRSWVLDQVARRPRRPAGPCPGF